MSIHLLRALKCELIFRRQVMTMNKLRTRAMPNSMRTNLTWSDPKEFSFSSAPCICLSLPSDLIHLVLSQWSLFHSRVKLPPFCYYPYTAFPLILYTFLFFLSYCLFHSIFSPRPTSEWLEPVCVCACDCCSPFTTAASARYIVGVVEPLTMLFCACKRFSPFAALARYIVGVVEPLTVLSVCQCVVRSFQLWQLSTLFASKRFLS